MRFILDASAALAVIFDEKAAPRVTAVLPDSSISSVNVAEVMAKLVERGATMEQAEAMAEAFLDRSVDFTLPQALDAGRMRSATRHRGLSLGDRACLALARSLGATAMTADRAWEGLDVGVAIEVVR